MNFLLHHHRLVVDTAAGQLVNTETMVVRFPTSTAEATGDFASVLSDISASYKPLFIEFLDVVNHSVTFPPSRQGVEHHIITSDRLVILRFQRDGQT